MADNKLQHHGIKGMKWGVRRWQNKDGTLTPAGKKREKKLDPKMQKAFNKAVWDKKGNFTNRMKVYDKMTKEAFNSKEGRAYSEVVKKRGILDQNGNLKTLSYLKEDWSNPEKVVDMMISDTNIVNAYNAKVTSIGKKYISEVRGAALKDLGYEDTAAGRAYLEKLHILDPK